MQVWLNKVSLKLIHSRQRFVGFFFYSTSSLMCSKKWSFSLGNFYMRFRGLNLLTTLGWMLFPQGFCFLCLFSSEIVPPAFVLDNLHEDFFSRSKHYFFEIIIFVQKGVKNHDKVLKTLKKQSRPVFVFSLELIANQIVGQRERTFWKFKSAIWCKILTATSHICRKSFRFLNSSFSSLAK